MSDTPQIPMASAGQAPPTDARAAERLQRRVRIIKNMGKIQNKWIVASGKGGVGKSTVAVHLAKALAAKGRKVGLLDMDLTGPNAPLMLGVKDAPVRENEDGGLIPAQVDDNLSVISMQFLLQDPDQAVVWRGPIKMQVIGQFLGDVAWGELDDLVVDLPPGSSDEPLSVAQNIPDANGMILVTTPQEVAVGDVRKSVSFARKLELPVLGVIENMRGLTIRGQATANSKVTLDTGAETIEADVDGEGKFLAVVNLYHPGGGEAMAEAMGVPFLGSVPVDPLVNRQADAGKTAFDVEGSPAANAFHAIVDRLLS